MNASSQAEDERDGYALDKEAQRRREAGADSAEADELPAPGPSKHKSPKKTQD